ncbi:uncharacterized protein LOC144743212 [Ciona intestinalis]
MFKIKEQIRLQTAKHDESLPSRSSSHMTTRSSSSKVAPGGVMQLTKLDILQRDFMEQEKELAKYKDIDTRRRSENQRLLDENNKFRRYLRAQKQAKASGSQASQKVPAATASPVKHEPGNKENEEICKQQ